MADVDMSAEAVERLAVVRHACGAGMGTRNPRDYGVTVSVQDCMDAATTLRTLRAALTQAEAERDKARAAATRWENAAVLAALPLEAMLMAGTTRLHAPETRKQINAGVAAVRAALGDSE